MECMCNFGKLFHYPLQIIIIIIVLYGYEIDYQCVKKERKKKTLFYK